MAGQGWVRHATLPLRLGLCAVVFLWAIPGLAADSAPPEITVTKYLWGSPWVPARFRDRWALPDAWYAYKAHMTEGDAPPVSGIERAQAALAQEHFRVAVEAFGAGDYERARVHLNTCHDLGGLGRDVRPLDAHTGVLAFSRPLKDGEPVSFLGHCIGRRLPDMERKSSGQWIDFEKGLIVHEVSQLEAIRDEFLSWHNSGSLVCVSAVHLWLRPEDALTYARSIGETTPGKAFARGLTPDESARVRREFMDATRPPHMLHRDAPRVVGFDRRWTFTTVADQMTFLSGVDFGPTGGDPVAVPVVGSYWVGDRLDVLPVARDDGRVVLHLCIISVRCIAAHYATFSVDESHVEGLVEIPVLRKQTWIMEFEARFDREILVGRVPDPEAPGGELQGRVLWTFVRVAPGTSCVPGDRAPSAPK